MNTSYQHNSGPTRTEFVPAGRFQPYRTTRARMNEHVNAEAGPSNLVPSLTQGVGLPTSQTSGCIPETAADAVNIQTTTEEEEAPVSSFYRSQILRVAEWSFGVRCLSGKPGSSTERENLGPLAYKSKQNLSGSASGCKDGGSSQNYPKIARH